MLNYILEYIPHSIFKYLDIGSILNLYLVCPHYYIYPKFIKYLINELTYEEIIALTNILNYFNQYFISGGFIAKYLNRTIEYGDIDIYIVGKSDDDINFLNQYIIDENKKLSLSSYPPDFEYVMYCHNKFIIINVPYTRIQLIYKYKPDYIQYIKDNGKGIYNIFTETNNSNFNFNNYIIYILYTFDLQICQSAIDYNNNLIMIESCTIPYHTPKQDRRYKKYLSRLSKNWNILY